MINKQCDMCLKSGAKSYDISLTGRGIDLKGNIDLCTICANKIKSIISKIEKEAVEENKTNNMG